MSGDAGGAVRRDASRILLRVERDGAFAAPLLERAERGVPDPRDRGLLHELVLGTLRGIPELDRAIGRLAGRDPVSIDPPVRAVLRVGLHQVLRLDRVPDHAAVDGAVRAARGLGASRAAGFVNAVLRRATREREDLRAPAPVAGDAASLALATGHATWWAERQVAERGWDAARAVLEADGTPAPTVLRVPAGEDIERRVAELASEGVRTEPSPWLPRALRVAAGHPATTGVFGAARLYVQDEASQLVPCLMGRPAAGPVLDLCAAPGGKTLQLAEALGSEALVVAFDRSEARIRRVVENLERTRTEGVVVAVGDVESGAPPVPPGSASAVLLDAPCTGSGTMRRRPELRMRLAPGDPAAFARRQARMLRNASVAVAPGGRLVYSVCSIAPEEGEAVAAGFLAGTPGFRVAPVRDLLPGPCRAFVGPDGAVRTTAADGLDGFYAVAFDRDAT